MADKSKNDQSSQQQQGQQQGQQEKGDQQSSQPSGDLPETTKPDGEGYTDTNAGPDAKEGTVADESPDPEEAK